MNRKYKFEDIELLDLAKARNYIPQMSTYTSFPINAGGRKILIGIDVNPFANDKDVHVASTDGNLFLGNGCGAYTDEDLIDFTLKEVEKQLRQLLLTKQF